MREHTGEHRDADAYTMKNRRLALCKQSPNQSLYEPSKSTVAVVQFHDIPQPSDTIPTSHLHIKQGCHSHTLTNGF